MSDAETAEVNERPRPIARNLALLVAFLALVTISVFTVLLPSIEDAPAQNAGGADAGTPSAPATPTSTP
ncbi:MAG: hypothetical protein GXP55_20335 [Deltaproteobacteria bacterium]|nr:hypothetical protein [Deltaproteobacteria bacterium]